MKSGRRFGREMGTLAALHLVYGRPLLCQHGRAGSQMGGSADDCKPIWAAAAGLLPSRRSSKQEFSASLYVQSHGRKNRKSHSQKELTLSIRRILSAPDTVSRF